MAVAVSSVNYTKEVANAPIETGYAAGQAMIMSDSYEASALGATATITFQTLPIGAIIQGITIAWDDLQLANTFSVGVTGATTSFFGVSSTPLIAAIGHVIVEDAENIIVTTSAHEATGTISVIVTYTR
jgi:hypothetical protein